MNKGQYLIEVWFISGIVGILTDFFGEIQNAYLILMILLVMDTFTGMAYALKSGRFNSRGFGKLLRKVITYSTGIITVRLMEIGVITFYETNVLSHLMVAFLQVNEGISILENLSHLGVPIPSNFVMILLRHLRIPGLKEVIKANKQEEKYVNEIDDIIRFQIAVLENENVKRMMEIKFEIWKTVIKQINSLLAVEETSNNELTYFRVLSVIEAALNEIRDKWSEILSTQCLDKFDSIHQPRLNNLLIRVKEICYLQETCSTKKEQLIESIKVLLYQTLLDVHKGFCCYNKKNN